MPVSPFKRAAEEGSGGHEPPPQPGGKKKRKVRQRKRELYQKVREDLQVSGDLPVAPEGALRPETVPSSAQGEQPMYQLIAEAIRRGWAVPEGMKPHLIDELVGIILNNDMPSKAKIAAFNALRMADQAQYERDNPVAAGQAKGASSTVAVSVQSNMLAVTVLREVFERDIGRGESALPAPIESGALGHGRFDGEVEVGAASTGDE